MNATLSKGIATTVVALLTLTGAACGGDSVADGPDPTATAAPTVAPTEPTAAPTPAPTATSEPTVTVTESDATTDDGTDEPAAWSNGSVGPGRFRTQGFSTPFSFTVGESWTPAFVGPPDNANILLPDVVILFVLDTTAASANALVEQLRATGGVELTDETTVDVGGQPGVRYVIGGDHGIVRIATTAGEFTLGASDEEAGRVTVLEIDGSVLAVMEVVGVPGPPTGWEESAAVVETIVWG